jgi:hypothetical protein
LIKEELEELKEAMIIKILKKLQMLNRYSLCYLWSRTCIWNKLDKCFEEVQTQI